MPSPLAFLGGLGQGFEGLGQDLNTRALLDKQQQRQRSLDALNRLIELQKVGGRDVGPDELSGNALLSTLGTPQLPVPGIIGQPSPASADTTQPPPPPSTTFGVPHVVTGPDGQRILLDPSQTPEALQEKRGAVLQARIDARAAAAQKATAALETQKEAAKTLAGVKQAKADYATLRALAPKHPLVQGAFDSDNAANYGAALRFEEQKQLQTAAAGMKEGDVAGTFQEPDAQGNSQTVGYTKSGHRMILGGAKPFSAGMGGQNAPQMAAAKANAESAMKIMDDYEKKLRENPELYGSTENTMAALASSPTVQTATGLMGALNSKAGGMSYEKLQKDNPELANYITAKKFMAEAVLNTHKRPNQTQYEIEQELSGVGPHPSPQQIDMVAARRKRMYDEVFANPNAGGVSAPKKTPTYEEWKKQQGLP